MSSVSFTKDDLQLLRLSTRGETGFRNVYVCGKDSFGNTRYHAKVKTGGTLRALPGSRSIHPTHSAMCVLAWYRAVYGDAWRDALCARKRIPWCVWREKSGYWHAAVWLWGGRVNVPPHEVKKKRVVTGSGLAAFSTRRDAERGLWRYVRDTLGLLAGVAVWRVGPATGV